MALRNWPPTKSEKRPRIVTDVVHGTINIFHPLETLVDTPEFQRLRHVKQLGLCSYVYPSAMHVRFSHCLGTYHLAYKLVDSLRRADPSWDIIGEDHLCVSAAALLHDLGHGPFSHLFDGLFREATGGKAPKHESISIRFIERLFSQENVKTAFAPYLGTGSQFDRNVQFICELVSSKKFDDNGRWLPLGRGIEKSFLYSVVNNDWDSIDVDKWDYLMRDSLNSGIAIAFNRLSVERLIENAWVCQDVENPKMTRIGWDVKVQANLEEVGVARQELHDRLYQHKAVRAIDAMVVRAMQLASPHLFFRGDDGREYPLNRVTEDLGAFLRTNDHLLTTIANSTSKELEEPRRLLEMIDRRKIPQRLDEEAYSPKKADHLLTRIGEGRKEYGPKSVEALIRSEVMKRMQERGIDKTEIILITRVLSRGMGRTDPMEKVLLVDGNHNPRILNKESLRLKKSESSSEIRKLGLYVPRGSSGSEVIQSIFDEVLVEFGLRSVSHRVSPGSSQG